jgi:hypothetical protein
MGDVKQTENGKWNEVQEERKGKKKTQDQKTRRMPEWGTRAEGMEKRGNKQQHNQEQQRRWRERYRKRNWEKDERQEGEGRNRETRNGTRIRIKKAKLEATVEGRK